MSPEVSRSRPRFLRMAQVAPVSVALRVQRGGHGPQHPSLLLLDGASFSLVLLEVLLDVLAAKARAELSHEPYFGLGRCSQLPRGVVTARSQSLPRQEDDVECVLCDPQSDRRRQLSFR